MTTTLKTIGIFLGAIVLLYLALHFGAVGYLAPLSQDQGAIAPATQETGLVGSRAPYFDLPDLAGDHHTLTQLNDRPLVVVFFATWNQQAADQVKILDDYLASHDDSLARIVAIDTQEERSAASSFMRRGGYKLQTLVDAQGSIGEVYKIKSLPVSFFIGRDGTVRDAYSGLMNQQAIAHSIEGIVQ